MGISNELKKNNKQLPPDAKRVFKGVIFEVWQWGQKMYDGSTATFERLKRANTAGVIATVGDRILIQLQSQPDKPEAFTSIPGGRCEEGESGLEAAKRELLEETGYVSDDWELWLEQDPVGKMIWTVNTYIARNCTYKRPPHLDAGEKITTRLISFDDFLMLSEDKNFYEKEIVNVLYRARFDAKFRKELHDLIFKK